ncbi:MAG TPA: metallopeptidase TldD-related protein [Acidimicrobiia bacterium]|nr:metallopeptidase TldD-related protein [Acidimicrobiia bacterium]
MRRAADIAGRLIEMVGDRADAEAQITMGTAELTRFANSFIHQNVGEEYVEVRLRLAREGRVATVTGNHSGDEGLAALVDQALTIASTQPVDPDWPGLTERVEIPDSDHADPSTVAATPEQRAQVVADFVAAGPGMRAAGYCDIDWADVAYANTSGHHATSRRSRATIDGLQQTDESAGAGHQTSVAFADLDGGAAGTLAAERTRMGADAFDLKPGDYEVVLGPEPVATIAAFLALYGLNGKAVNEGQSFAALGEAQFDERITLVDDPLGTDALASPFDIEGTPKTSLTLVSSGVTVTLAHDRRSAHTAGAKSTGHAWTESVSWFPFAQHLVVTPGNHTVDEMIAAVDRGVYVATFNYCRILDPKTQVVTGLTRNGTFMIENGAITGAVTNLRFTQSFLAAWSPGNVAGIGNDLRYADCEFGHGLVRAPSMHLAEFRFTGGAEG